MSRLIASDNALRALLLLSQCAAGMRVSEVATALDISYTGAEKAVDILVADGFATISDHRCSLLASPRVAAASQAAFAFLSPEDVVASLANGNESVEFAGLDHDGVLIVFRRFADPAGEGRMRLAIDQLRRVVPEAVVELIGKETVRETLLDDLSLRRRAGQMTVLVGRVDRTFPDRTRRGDPDARPLGHLNEVIKAPSAARLRRLARSYGLRRIVAFGSATREDFRPDSDIDLLVEPIAGHRLGLDARVGLIAEVERLFDRDVDLLAASPRHPALVQRISRDGVVLYDAAR